MQKVDLGPWVEMAADPCQDASCAGIEENDEIDLYFNSTDPQARLYLDALECCPVTERIMVDDEGLVYCTPSEDVIKIYRSDSNYDALRVDTLQMSVVCNSNSYVSFCELSLNNCHYLNGKLCGMTWKMRFGD